MALALRSNSTYVPQVIVKNVSINDFMWHLDLTVNGHQFQCTIAIQGQINQLSLKNVSNAPYSSYNKHQ